MKNIEPRTGTIYPKLDEPTSEFLRPDALTNALDSLQRCVQFLETFPEPYGWKWAILALHQAIYGFAVCAVRGTDSRSVLKPPKKGGRCDLISVWTALERAKNKTFIWPTATPLRLTKDEHDALERLFDEFRNGFAHYQPAGWSIEIKAMAEVFETGVSVARRLAVTNGLILYYDEIDRQLATEALNRLEDLLSVGRSR